MLNLLRKEPPYKQEARRLHDALVTRSRAPVFFLHFRVPDTIDGRFDMVVLHAWLALTELQAGGLEAQAQALTDLLFTGFDEAMREQGAGDIGIGHRLKDMAKAFYGRLGAYREARDEASLAAALARNLWRGAAPDGRAQRLAAYCLGAPAHLRAGLPETLDFGPLPII